MQRFIAYFCSVYVSVTFFCYFAFGKEIIETNGFIGGSPVLNNFDDFLYYCLQVLLTQYILCAVIYFGFSKSYQFSLKRNFKFKTIHLLLIYAVFWLLSATSIADGCAMNWGNTWSYLESFEFVALAHFKFVVPFLATGMLSALLIEKYL